MWARQLNNDFAINLNKAKDRNCKMLIICTFIMTSDTSNIKSFHFIPTFMKNIDDINYSRPKSNLLQLYQSKPETQPESASLDEFKKAHAMF